jgi:hypothetical protein
VSNESHKPGTTARTRYVPVFSIEPEASRTFLQMLCGKDADHGETVVEDATLYLEAIAGENAHAAAIKESLKKADAAILLVRFLDTLSINQLREIYQSLPNETFLPRSLLIFRQKGEVEFKMSCSNCGQKLWVRDADAGRAGRCPHCKKTFVLPSQAANVRNLLELPSAVSVAYVSQGNMQSCTHAVTELIGKIWDRETALKSQTIRVQIPPEETSPGVA